MAEKKMKRYSRHDFVVVSNTGRQRISKEILEEYSGAEQSIVRELFSGKYGETGIPGIVRRAVCAEEGLVPVGFVPPERLDGRRLRIGAFAYFSEVVDIVTPYELLRMAIDRRNRCMQAVGEIAKLILTKANAVGVLGSVGLEIFTGIPYTNEDSDIDLVVQGCTYDEITKIFKQITDIGSYYDIPIDLEIALTNGYGIKAVELFMDTKTLLGKSLDAVALLERKAVLEVLTKKEIIYNGN
jgi:malonate decarboxylase holo-[acyl-carrier-protein] synthase